MSGEVVSCPRCGAAESVPVPEEPGARACAYCGTRFAPHEQEAAPPPPPPPRASPNVALAGIFGLVVLAGLVAAIVNHTVPPRRYLRDAARPGARRVEPPPRPTREPAADPTREPAAEPASVTSRQPPVAVSVPAPAPRPAPTGRFEEHGRVDTGSSYYLLGVITNTSAFTVAAPQVEVVLLDADGAEVGLARPRVWVDALAAGEACPVSLLVYQPPAHSSHRVELRLSEPTYLPEPATGLTVAPLPPEETPIGWRFSGSVTNGGDRAAQFVAVRIAGYDADERLVGVAQAYAASTEGIEPGGVARYQLTESRFARRPARFEVVVTGRVKRD